MSASSDMHSAFAASAYKEKGHIRLARVARHARDISSRYLQHYSITTSQHYNKVRIVFVLLTAAGGTHYYGGRCSVVGCGNQKEF